MRVAAGRSFFECVADRADTLVPKLEWVFIKADGSAIKSPEACELLVLAGESYTSHFVDTAFRALAN